MGPTDEVKIRLTDGRWLAVDQEVTVDGVSGRFRWLGRVCKDGSLELWGGRAGREQFRCIRQANVKTVHRIAKTRKGSE